MILPTLGNITYITIQEFDPYRAPTVLERSKLEVTILEIDNYGTNCRACSYFTADPLSCHVTDTSSTVNVFFWIKDIKANPKSALQTLQLPIFFTKESKRNKIMKNKLFQL